MKQQNKFTSQEKQQHVQQHTQEQTGVEFGSVDEMLRYDALHTITPPDISKRLRDSLGDMPQTSRPWWRKIFGK